MSQLQINLSPDLVKLQDDGYEVSIEYGHLVIGNVPYLNNKCEICYGALVSVLSLSGNRTNKPHDHIAMFSGEHPCDAKGNRLGKISHNSATQHIGENLVVHHSFSSKPKGGYVDYYDKMSTYASIISHPAISIDPSVTAQTGRVISSSSDSPFTYLDNATGRAGISSINKKLEQLSIGIIGLGGTGSYLLDFISKSPVEEIHLYDADIFEQHNAFRAPGAATIDQLQERPLKVDYFAQIYSSMHKSIIPHQCSITNVNRNLLRNHDMVFICIDSNEAKKAIVEALEEFDINFIDVGMGVDVVEGSLTAMLRTTTSVPNSRSHVRDKNNIPMVNANDNNVYASNIQLSELNALNAIMAILKWKRMYGFYRDTEHEEISLFNISSNRIINEGSE